MKNTFIKKGLVGLVSTALVAAFAVATPSAARAADLTCTKSSNKVETCTGTDANGAKFEIRMPANFNGTLYVYAHGIRTNVDLPPIPVVAPTGSKIDYSPEVVPGNSTTIANSLLKQGFALAGSGVQTQGWSLEEGTDSFLQVLQAARDKYSKVNKVVAWGNSLGALTAQAFAEQYSGAVDAVVPMCLADSAQAEITMAGDFLWGLKTFFNPAIKGFGYSAGRDGYVEMLTDLGTVLQTLLALRTAIAADPVAPKWPATSTVPATLQAIPVRSAILLLGLVAGISTQSKTYDSSSGPAGPLETTFGVAISPALAVLENGAEAAALAILANYDMERRAGGIVYDNSKTNFAKRLGDDSQVYAAALSGGTATNGMIGYLQFLAPKVTADAAAVAKLNSLYQLQGKIEVPTITLAAPADHITPGGAVTHLINQYNASVSAGSAKSGLLLNIWNKPADTYSTFDAKGGVTPDKWPNGVGHCNYTASQVLTVAKLGATAAKTGKLPSDAAAKAAIKNDKSLFIDPNFLPPLLKFRQ
jgi:pimeloyl-ACP methyl ester carboxylesterase